MPVGLSSVLLLLKQASYMISDIQLFLGSHCCLLKNGKRAIILGGNNQQEASLRRMMASYNRCNLYTRDISGFQYNSPMQKKRNSDRFWDVHGCHVCHWHSDFSGVSIMMANVGPSQAPH